MRWIHLWPAAAALLVGCSSTPAAIDPPTTDPPPTGSGGPTAGPVESHGDGPSCDDAVSAYERDHGAVGEEGALSPEDEASVKEVLGRGSYLNQCEVPASASVEICAAILEGGVRGVTVRIDPALQNQVDCVAASVLRMEFPSYTQMTQARTSFEPEL